MLGLSGSEYGGNYLKFSEDDVLKGILLGTGNRDIVKASLDDRFEGVGFDRENAEVNIGSWGENRLNKALVRVRERLRKHVRRHGERAACIKST